MTGNGTILSLTGVQKEFAEPTGALRVLDGLTMQVRRGEIMLLQGPSGSGKTTLLQIAGTMLRADAGSVHIAGMELNGASDEDRASARRHHLGFVFQHFHLVEALSVRENVALGLRLKRRLLDDHLISEMLELLGITGKADKLPRDLSGGEKQRAAFARALAPRPNILLADEPTSQLDAHATDSLADLVKEVVEHLKITVVVATHDVRLHRIADRVATLRNGRLDG